MSDKESNKLITVPDKDMPNLSRIVYANGGPTPDVLSGLYTGFTMAQKAIKAYLQLKPVHKPQVYNGEKNLTNEQETEAFEKVKEKVEKDNAVQKQGTEKGVHEEVPSETQGKDEQESPRVLSGEQTGSETKDESATKGSLPIKSVKGTSEN